MATKYDKRTLQRVEKLRDRDNLSWLKIRYFLREAAKPVDVSASTVRRMYDTSKGRVGAHREVPAYVLPGGRRAQGFGTPDYDPAATLKPSKNGAEQKPKAKATKPSATKGTKSKVKVQKDTVTQTVPTKAKPARKRTTKRSPAAEKSMATVRAAEAEELREAEQFGDGETDEVKPKVARKPARARKGAATKAVKANA